MKKIAQGIVRFRKLILTVAFLLLIPSAIGAVATRINYDILTYLPQDLDSMIGEVALEDDFHLASTGMITVEGLPTNELIAMKKDIEAVPGVMQTFWLSDVIDPSIPTEMLPADVQQFMFGKNDSTMLIVRFDAPSASDETMNAVSQIETLLRKDCFFGGMSVILQDTKALVNQEMPFYILIAVGASLLVLFLSLESTITPLLFMLGLLFPIAYNFGTNIFLGQISYITEALATVLQLGVTMDFSIFLLHRYQEEKELRSNNEEAMVSAICKTMTSISASSLTTIAGFLALCAMRLTLGRDIGIVMAKGVALGVICTVVVLPALILSFDRLVEKYKHRTIIPKLTKLSYFVSSHAAPIVAIFILVLVPFIVAQSKTEVYYTLFDSLPQDLVGIVGTNKLGEDFGMTTSHFILVHDDLTATQVSDLCDEINDVDGITQVVSLDSITGPGFDTSLVPDSVMEILQSGGYKLILANSSYKTGTDAINDQLDQMIRLIKAVDPEGVITGLEFAYGIPGTVGGAVYMNAGAYGGEMKDVLASVRYLTGEGEIVEVPAEQLDLRYRHSIFEENGGCILSAKFYLARGSASDIRAKMDDLMARRRDKQPLDKPSAGSTFKRPVGAFAAALIDQCGLRGYRHGGAAVSEKHCGFVVNLGGATCADVLALCDEVRAIVKEKTGYDLEKEIRVVAA